jgi:hypothetical protein
MTHLNYETAVPPSAVKAAAVADEMKMERLGHDETL